MQIKKVPVACLVEKDTLKTNKKFSRKKSTSLILRSDFIKNFLNIIPKKVK